MLLHKAWLKAFNNMGHIIKIGKHDKIRLQKKVRLKEILILKENHFSGYMKFVSSSIITNKTFLSITIPHKTNTPKSMKGLILRMITKQAEIRRVILQGLHWQVINQVDSNGQGFNPKFRWNGGFN